MSALAKVNILAFIGIFGAILLFIGDSCDYDLSSVSELPAILFIVRSWIIWITVLLTLIFCLIRLVRRHYAFTKKRLIPMGLFYIIAGISCFIYSPWAYNGFPVITTVGLLIGYAGCVICAFKVLPTGDHRYADQQSF